MPQKEAWCVKCKVYCDWEDREHFRHKVIRSEDKKECGSAKKAVAK